MAGKLWTETLKLYIIEIVRLRLSKKFHNIVNNSEKVWVTGYC